MNSKSLCYLAAFITSTVLSEVWADPVVVLTNTGTISAGGSALNGSNWKALLFTTPSSRSEIVSIQLGLNCFTTNAICTYPTSRVVGIDLYSVQEGVPLNPVYSIPVQSVTMSGPSQSYSFSIPSWQLSPVTSYAIVVKSDAGELKWANISGVRVQGANGFSYSNALITTSLGIWSAIDDVTSAAIVGNNAIVVSAHLYPSLATINSPQTYTGSALAAAVSCSSAGTVSNVLYDGNASVPAGAGTYAVTADCAAAGIYSALTGASAGNFVISAGSQTITAVATPASVNAGSSITLSSAGSSGSGAVTYNLVSGPCTLTGTRLRGTSEGTCMVTATIAADSNYSTATSSALSVPVGPVPPAAGGSTYVSANLPMVDTLATAGSFSPGTTFFLSVHPTHGTVTLATGGTFTYSPAPGFEGIDTFGFIACDDGVCSTGIRTMVVAQAQVQVSQQTTSAGNSNVLNVTAGVTWKGLPASSKQYQRIISIIDSTHGPAAIAASSSSEADLSTYVQIDTTTGNVSVQPNTPAGVYEYQSLLCLKSKDLSAMETFFQLFGIKSAFADSAVDVTLSGSAPCVYKTISILVDATVDAVDDNFNAKSNEGFKGTLASNDAYTAGSIFALSDPATKGKVVIDESGSFRFRPKQRFKGVDNFSYKLCRAAPNQSECDTAKATLYVGINKIAQQPLSLRASATVIKQNRTVTLVMKKYGTDGNGDKRSIGSPTFQVTATGGATCRIKGKGRMRTLRIKGPAAASCTVTASKQGNKQFSPVTSNSVTVALP